MEKLEQIQNLLIEWQKENPEKRAVNLVAIEVENENKDGYSASVSGAIIGKETFKANTADSKAIADSARKAVEAKKDKIAQAMNQATGATAQAETVDPETGEIIQPVTENPAPKAESKTNKSSKEPSK